MVILAHLLRGNTEWAHARLRILRVVGDEAGREPAEASLRELITAARVDAEPVAVVSRSPFPEVLQQESRDADFVLLGLKIPAEGEEIAFHETQASFLSILPPTLMVHSSGEADVEA
jgi:hypothetical protein